MIGAWIAGHRSLVATLGSSAALTVAIATTAVLSGGYTAQKMDLDDGSAWVVNNAEHAVGRANPVVGELNSVVTAQGKDLEVVQEGSTILLVDRANASLDIIDPATSESGDTVALPPEQPEVWLAGTNAVILAEGTGEVWIVPIAELQSFDPATQSTYTFGKNTVATVSSSGMLYAYSGGASTLYRVDAVNAGGEESRSGLSFPAGSGSSASSSSGSSSSGSSSSGSSPSGSSSSGSSESGTATTKDYEIAAIGDEPVVLDATDRVLAVGDRKVDLSRALTSTAAPRLQQTASGGGSVLVAGGSRLLSIALDSGRISQLVAQKSGLPAAPVVRGGCVWAAWSVSGVWTRCGSSAPRTMTLSSLDAAAKLVFVAGESSFVLNDAASGDSWAIEHGGTLIDNWSDLLKKDDDKQVQDEDEDKPPTTEQEEQPPVAVDDEFGARPGRSSVLPVLLNDYDPNGDVLVIDQVDAIPADRGRLDIISKGQQLLITLPADATGTIVFGYTIDDGRGGTASARVTVTVRHPGENSPPVQVRTTKTTVQAGGQVTTQVLGDWYDPDGDPMYLAAASVAAPDKVSSKPDGSVLFTDFNQGGDLKSIALQVSDGTAVGTGSLAVTVRQPGQVPIIADPFVVSAYTGQQITVSPLEHVRGGNGTIRLNAVPATTGVTITASFDKGTFQFSSDQARTVYLEYVVTDGTQTVTGQIRVDVTAPPANDSRPITVPKSAFVRFGQSVSVDVADTDIDPAGGVLMVTGVSGLPATGSIRAEIIEQRSVRVTTLAPLEAPVTFSYTVTNGAAEATGSITVIEIPSPAIAQPPIARDDTVNVRAGDTIDIPVLANDEQPDGEELALDPELVGQLPSGGGLLFVSGDHLRYLAPTTAGNYSAEYRVTSAGQFADAHVYISVREPDAATNNAPVPPTITARVTAGDTVRIPVPLTGIDPDGDSVQLVGQASPPDKGTVEEVGDDWIDYEAGAYSSGTDSFTYTVIDSLGGRATGTVRVGISPRSGSTSTPIAVADEVTVRPGRTVSVQVLANDSDPDGGTLTVTGVQVQAGEPGLKAKIESGRIVDVTPPSGSGKRDYSVIYTIENETGGRSSAFVTVHVDPDAPLARPTVDDTTLTVTEVLGKTTIDVPVLKRAFFADGPTSTLQVGLLDGWSQGAQVLSTKTIRVTIGKRNQIIPFSVANPDDPRIKAYAFIRVPGTDDALPQLNTRAPAISVKSEQTVTIDLDQYVVAIGDGRIRLTGSTNVTATHSDGADLVVNDHSLAFTSAAQYFGPASITFEVTDGSPDDPSARKAVLTLPIKVLPRNNQPPVFLGAQLDLEPGQSREIDLVKLTDYPYQSDLAELAYSVSGQAPAGFSYQLNGQRLDITADYGTATGTTSTLTLGVKDAISTGKAGTISLRVVPSTKPLAAPIADAVIAPRGQTTTIDVLANDQTGNPFPGQPLKVVAIAGLGQAALPNGITATPSSDRSRVAITVSNDAAPGDVSAQYEVADATGDPSRYVWASLKISVQDRPDPVSAVTVTEFGDRTLKLSWQPGPANNSPITRFDVTAVSAADGRVVATTSCTTSASCALTTPGNGPSNAVRISVVEVNSIGSSEPSSLAGTIWSDVIPPPPTGLSSTPLDGGLRVSWTKPADSGAGSPITYYVVTVGGASTTYPVDPGASAGSRYSVNVYAGAANGSATSYSVSARNSAPNSLARWNSASSTGTPAGPPISTGSPQASTSGPTSATLGWNGIFSANGTAIRKYYAVAYFGQQPSCTVRGVDTGSPTTTPPSSDSTTIVQTLDGATTSTVFSGLATNQKYTLVVFADNGQGCQASPTAVVTPRRPPADVTGATFSGPINTGDGTWDYTVDQNSSTGSAGQVIYRLVGDGVDGSTYGPVSMPAALVTSTGTQYGRSFQVQLKACVSYSELAQPLCSTNWSGAIDVPGVPVRIDLAGWQHDAAHAPDDGLGWTSTWSWSSSTAGDAYPGYASAQVSCDGGQSFQDLTGGPQTCDAPTQLLPAGFPDLLVRVTTTAGVPETRTYPW